jgi:SAM-dependent methyltransferase
LISNGSAQPGIEYDATYFTQESPQAGSRDFLSPWAQRYDEARFGRELDEHLTHPGSLLDIGSATGSFLSIAQARGWRVLGVEVSQAAREIAAGHGHRCVATMGEAAEHGPFDAITMHHVLEHLDDPVGAVREAVSLLRPSGRLLIEVPNWNSLERRACGQEWVDLRPEQHLRQFEPATLRRVLLAADARVQLITTLVDPIPSAQALLTAVGAPLDTVRRVMTATAVARRRHVSNTTMREQTGAVTRSGMKGLISRWEERVLGQRWGKRLLAVAAP